MAKKKAAVVPPPPPVIQVPQGPKLVLFSDLHYREESMETCLQVLNGVFEAAMATDRKVACLGDFWHFRYHLPIELLNRLGDELTKWVVNDVELIMLPGNHDQIDLNGRHALEVFMGWPNIRIYTEPTVDEWGLWIPYRKNPLQIIAELDKHRTTLPTVFAHCGIRGAAMNSNIIDTDGIPADAFGGYRNVILGHYHRRQTLKGSNTDVVLQYVGSPWETRADEGGDPKGYAIWPGHGQFIQYVDQQWGPKHRKLEVSSPEELKEKMKGVVCGDGDRVRIQVTPGGSLEAVSSAVAALGMKGLTVEPLKVDSKEVRLALGAGAGWHEYAAKYIEYESTQIVASNLDPKTLITFFDAITNPNVQTNTGS